MNVIIIEDEKITADDLAGTITALDSNVVINAVLSSVKTATAYFQTNKAPDLIFSDVQLGDGLSFEIFKLVPVSAPVIFCTAYDEYALNAFKTNGIDYVLKPFTSKTIAEALEKYRKLRSTFSGGETQYKALLDALVNREGPKSTSILVHHKEKIMPVRLDEIAMFYIETEMTHILTLNGKLYHINKSLEELELSCGSGFFRVNRQYLVNRKAVIDASHYFSRKLSVNILIPFKDKILVSKEKIPQFLKWLEQTH
jgi:DNA-binding LytR/AlgR family response regulator